MLKVGIVGCGEIANRHVSFIKNSSMATIIGVADTDKRRLESFSRRYGISSCHENIDALLAACKPEVVHILTPPFSHKELAIKAIQHGIHVYIEKPLALNSNEAREIYSEAERKEVKVCVGCNFMFDDCVQKAMEIIQSTKFGRIIYVEYFYGNDMRRYDRLRTTAENEIHWSYYLPGGVHQNYISHPLYFLSKLMGAPRNLSVVCKSTGALPQQLTDEIRVLLEWEKTIGLLALSYACKPYQHYIKIFGEKQTVCVDIRCFTTTVISSTRIPKAISRVLYNNLNQAAQLSLETMNNVVSFGIKRLYPYKGMDRLINVFYKSIIENTESPVSKELVLTAEETADKIFSQCRNLHLDFTPRPSRQPNIRKREKVLVTGASGYLGLFTVKRLIAEGYRVRAFVRKLSYIDQLEREGVEIFFGDIRHYESFREAAEGMDIIVHLAAAMNVPASEYEDITVGGVRNLIRISNELEIKKIVYISSMSVYDRSEGNGGKRITEDYPLEKRPHERGAYTLSKVMAEKLVLQELAKDRENWTVLRPSIIHGPGKTIAMKQIGGFQLTDNLKIVFGSGEKRLRLVRVEDVVEAIYLSIANPKSRGKIYNIVGDELISKKEYIEKSMGVDGRNGLTLYIPYPLIYGAVYLQELLFKILKRKPFLTRYRLRASNVELNIDNLLIKQDLGWKPIY